MGETRPDMPISSQLILMPPPRTEDEIRLVDIWRVLAKRKRVLWGIVFLSLSVGVAFALLTEKEYTFRGGIEIGSLPDNNGPRMIEEPETLAAKIVESFVWQATTELTNDQPEYTNRLKLKTRIPKDSSLVIVEAQAPQSMKEVYLKLIGQVLALVTEDHAQTAEKIRIGLKARLKEAELQRDELEAERTLLDQRLEKLTSGDGSLGSQIRALREQIRTARSRLSAQSAARGDSGGAEAAPEILGDLAADQQYLMSLEEELRREQDKLSARISQTQKDLQNTRMFTLDIQQELDGVRESRAVVPIQLPEQVRRDRKMIVALAGVLGLLLGVIAALFMEFLSKARTDTADTNPGEPGI